MRCCTYDVNWRISAKEVNMKKKILIVHSRSGGVSAYWKPSLRVLKQYNDIHVSTLEIGGEGRNIFSPLVDQWNFRNKIKTKYDLVLLNPSLGWKSFFRDALFAKKLNKSKIPFMLFFHGWEFDFEKKVDQKYKNFFLHSLGRAKKIFVLSRDFKQKILEWGYKGEVVIETTNVDSVLINNFSIEEKLQSIPTLPKKRILFLARLLREKGVFELVEAFENILTRIDNCELIIAGSGKDYEELTKRVGNNSSITVVGHVQGKDKIDLYKKSLIYCLPSYTEGLPVSVLEAMAFGLPVITTDIGGLKDFFQDEKMGYFVKPKDVKQLSEKLELLLLDLDKIVEVGRYNFYYANEKLLDTVVAERMYHHMKSVWTNY